MITKIKKIENLGIFSEYSAREHPCPDFEKHNIIYGMNGAGKTTLSKLFEIMASKSEVNKNGEGKKAYGNVKYKVIDDNGKICSSEDDIIFPIRVFNRDYVEENVKFATGKTNPISLLLIGSELIEKEKTLERFKSELDRGKMRKSRREYKIKEIKSEVTEQFEIARKSIRRDLGFFSRDYTLEDVMEDYNQLKMKHLSISEIINKKQIFKGAPKDKQELINLKEKEKHILIEAKRLFRGIIYSRDAEREAYLIHQAPKSHYISADGKFESREELLTDAMRKNRMTPPITMQDILGKKINNLISEIESREAEIEGITILEKSLLHQDLAHEYSVAGKNFENNRKTYLLWLQEIKKQLKEKENKIDERIDLSVKAYSGDLFEDIKLINKIIAQHNRKIEYSADDKLSAYNAIKGHHLAPVFRKTRNLEARLEMHERRIKEYELKISDFEARISKLEKITHSTSTACEYISSHIKMFFGREEIKFSLSKDGDGYLIERDGQPAIGLSEGEKTAIAFIYFMCELHDKSDKSVVVIDDPVSSLDSNSLYNAFSLLIGLTEKDIAQLFIFTHNFEFLRMLLGYYNSHKKKKPPCRYFMVKNKMTEGKRRAYIGQLDKMLESFSNEYQYLFYKLYEFKENGDANLDISYPVPNMMRKFLEIFLEFQVPEKGSLASKLKALEKEDLNSYEISEIIKFANENSHGNNVELDPNIIENSKKLLSCIFEIVRHENENHYGRMVKYIEGTDSFKKKS